LKAASQEYLITHTFYSLDEFFFCSQDTPLNSNKNNNVNNDSDGNNDSNDGNNNSSK
jgi:hypothetical protein